MTKIYAIHRREQLEAFYEDFQTEWLEFPPKLAKAGMPNHEIVQVEFQCWHHYLKRRGFLVDDFSERA